MSDDDPPPSRARALAALAVLAVLVLGGFWLSRQLASVSRTEDCVMAGRRNCAPIDPTSGQAQPPR